MEVVTLSVGADDQSPAKRKPIRPTLLGPQACPRIPRHTRSE